MNQNTFIIPPTSVIMWKLQHVENKINTNAVLAEVIQKLQCESYSLAASAGPDEMMYDLGFHRKLKAVKFCLTCPALFCETHVGEQLQCTNISF